MPHANQKARHYSLRQVLNSLRPNVFILNIRGKLLHQRRAMSSEPSALLKSPAAKHTFNYIITLKIVFVQSIVGIKCGSMRLVLKKMCPCHDKTICRGMKGQENSRALLWHRAQHTMYESMASASELNSSENNPNLLKDVLYISRVILLPNYFCTSKPVFAPSGSCCSSADRQAGEAWSRWRMLLNAARWIVQMCDRCLGREQPISFDWKLWFNYMKLS